MTVKEIVSNYLSENGFDGLCNQEYECGCGNNDEYPFMACGEYCEECEPAYRNECQNCAILVPRGCDLAQESDHCYAPWRYCAKEANK